MTLPELTPDHLRTLRHMLGINDGRRSKPVPYRNYYAANADDPTMLELQRVGAVWRRVKAGDIWGDNLDIWHATDPAVEAAIASFATIRVSRGRRMYHEYLRLSDVYADLTFRDFLTNPEFESIRRSVTP